MVAAFILADPDALGVVAIGAEGRCAGRAYPFRSTLVAAFLFLKTLTQGFHKLVETAQRFDQFLLFLGQMFFRQPPQPFLGKIGHVDAAFTAEGFDALEKMTENLVEAVHVPFVLHERGSRQIVESLDIIGHEPCIHALEQRQIFPQGNGNFRRFEFKEEGDEH